MPDDMDNDTRDTDADRRLAEITGELRLVLPVVSILFVFLITLPFTARFESLSRLDRTAYFIAFLSSAFSIVLLLGETAYHQLQNTNYDKAKLVSTASRQTITGMALLAIALPAVTFLVTDLLYRDQAAATITAGLAATVGFTWFILPLRRRRAQKNVTT
ncbi:DUF6328 family protein [Tenggerimyces flavus]|uniref:DUF6328 family protein n=1 Tax=Tenggerimyces flavus TaxID=1708749 RepID=A0ABV7YNJ9_9ACTN|nr:DUF6328 family protein [Tenggerimyces flavus]MBM7790211.1 hypothetical protein [Tenggerimyces flavus]